MASSLNGTGVTFSDATTQSTARTASNTVTSFIGQVGAVDPTVTGAIGSIVQGCYMVTSPAGTSSAGTYNINSYATGTTISGSSLAYNIQRSLNGANGNYSYLWPTQVGGNTANNFEVIRSSSNNTPVAFPASNTSTYTYYQYSSGLSGSWRSLAGSSVIGAYVGCCTRYYNWGQTLWQRYA